MDTLENVVSVGIPDKLSPVVANLPGLEDEMIQTMRLASKLFLINVGQQIGFGDFEWGPEGELDGIPQNPKHIAYDGFFRELSKAVL